MNTVNTSFHPLARLLHMLMAIMVLSMLFIGAGMVATVSENHQWLLAIHKPLGICILILVIVRVIVRLRFPPPPLPLDLPAWQRFAAYGSQYLLYALMFAMPLIGWAMVSAGGYPVMLSHAFRLPSILPANPFLFAWLREAHRYLAYLFFVTFLAHMGAALYHGLIRRDGVFSSMIGGGAK